MIQTTEKYIHSRDIYSSNDRLSHHIYTKFVERREAKRNIFSRPLPKTQCQINDAYFKASIANCSSSGAFIKTLRPLSVGQEIAITFSFPESKNIGMVTGEVARVSDEGVGIVFKVIFRK
ncbi:MAG: PilZ domain-containing protein [Desulfobacterales bacterium]|jgi:hypothetical protein